MANPIVEEYRRQHPTDTGSDAEITAFLLRARPDLAEALGQPYSKGVVTSEQVRVRAGMPPEERPTEAPPTAAPVPTPAPELGEGAAEEPGCLRSGHPR